MVKKLFVFFLFIDICFALSSLELAKNIVNNPSKDAQLELLFSGKSYKDSSGNLDIDNISRVLKTNSLLSLTLSNSQSLNFSFRAKADSVVFFKIINDALNEAGYAYFIPTELILKDDFIAYTIQVDSKYILDPGVFYRLLRASFVGIENIKRVEAYHYAYDLDFDRVKLKTNTDIELNTNKQLEKPFKDYTFALKGAKNITILASTQDAWYPKILFLDKNFNLIKAVKSQVKNNQISEFVPNGATYVIVSDMYSLDNIKRGLNVTLSK